MRLLSVFILIISILTLIMSLTFYYLFLNPIDSFEVYSSVSISDEIGIGIDLNSSALTFGSIGHGGTSLRKVTIVNDYSFPLIIKTGSSGNISPMLSYKPKIYLPAFSNVSVPVTAFSSGEKTGFYDGNVNFELFRTTNKLFND